MLVQVSVLLVLLFLRTRHLRTRSHTGPIEICAARAHVARRARPRRPVLPYPAENGEVHARGGPGRSVFPSIPNVSFLHGPRMVRASPR